MIRVDNWSLFDVLCWGNGYEYVGTTVYVSKKQSKALSQFNKKLKLQNKLYSFYGNGLELS